MQYVLKSFKFSKLENISQGSNKFILNFVILNFEQMIKIHHRASSINTVKIGLRIALENFTTRKSDWTKLQCQQQESWDIRSLKLRK